MIYTYVVCHCAALVGFDQSQMSIWYACNLILQSNTLIGHKQPTQTNGTRGQLLDIATEIPEFSSKYLINVNAVR